MALPSRPRSRSSLPDGSASSATMPRGTHATLPIAALYAPPPLSHFSGTGTLSATAVPCATAVFTGIGGLEAVGAPTATAGFSGEGTFLVPTNETNAEFSGIGVLSATAIPCATAVFTGEGTATAAVVGTTQAQFSGSGTLTGPAVPAATAAFSGAGTLSAVGSVFTPSGMNKTAGTTIGTSYAVVQTWTADTATYPGSTVSNHGLVVIGSTTNGRVETSLVVANGSFSQVATVTLRFHLNGNATAFHTSTGTNIPANSSATVSTFATGVTLASGDVITLQAISTAVTNARTINSGWLRITQP